MEEELEEIGKKIKLARVNKSIQSKYMANKLGVSNSLITKIEAGKVNPNKYLSRINKILETNFELPMISLRKTKTALEKQVVELQEQNKELRRKLNAIVNNK